MKKLVCLACLLCLASRLFAQVDPFDRAPTIRLQPKDTTVRKGKGVLEGDSAIFTVMAEGYPSPSYQWRHNGKPLSGQNEPYLYLKDCDAFNEGEYDCVVSNKHASIMTDQATLTVVSNNGNIVVVEPGDNLKDIVDGLAMVTR